MRVGLRAEPSRGFFLQAASVIARRLSRTATWSGDSCTWDVQKPGPGPMSDRRWRCVPASGELYQGSAGIGLFLAEVGTREPDRTVVRTAEAALRHALRSAALMPTRQIGFHTGRVGVAYAAARAGHILGIDSLLSGAWGVLAPLCDAEVEDQWHDAIGGAAGAIPALLASATWTGRDELTDLAVSYGDHLVRTAVREVIGWSWNSPSYRSRNLTGFAHGAAGIGLGLLELAAASGDPRFRYAGEQAFEYERRCLLPETNNWPDFRDGKLTVAMSDRREATLERLRSGDGYLFSGPHQQVTWCSGAAGIGLARLRAFELHPRAEWREEAEVALTSTKATISPEGRFSLCHGVPGNAETLMAADEVLGRRDCRTLVEEVAVRAWRLFEEVGVPWLSGVGPGLPDPSLMLGDAGVGLFYLRLADGAVPSVLAPRPAGPLRQVPDPDGDLAVEHARSFFGPTLEAVTSAGGGLEEELVQVACADAPVIALAGTLARLTNQDTAPAVVEQYEVDRAGFEISLNPVDLREDLVFSAWLAGMDGKARALSSWQAHPSCRLIPRPSGTGTLLLRRGGVVRRTPAGRLIVAILSALSDGPRRLPDLAETVATALGLPLSDRLSSRISQQIDLAAAAGVLVPHEAVAPHRGLERTAQQSHKRMEVLKCNG